MKYLGLDWGMKNIGMASSDGQLASSFGSLEISSLQQAISKVVAVVQKQQVETIVIGLPEGEMGKNVQKAVKLLEAQGCKVELTDETLSSKNALQTMIEMGVSQKARRKDHAIAAMLLLQEYLDNQNKQ